MYFFSKFVQKIGLDMSCKYSPAEKMFMNFQTPFSGKQPMRVPLDLPQVMNVKRLLHCVRSLRSFTELFP